LAFGTGLENKCWHSTSLGIDQVLAYSACWHRADTLGVARVATLSISLKDFNFRHVALMRTSLLNRAERVFVCVRV
jgi:hypothetical protein